MLISDSKAFIFVHIEKTGGTSMTQVLRPYALRWPPSGWHSVLRSLGLPRDYHRFRFPTHCGLRVAERQMPAEVYQRYFKFAFVRNPWDRLVSEYNAAVHKNRKPRHQRIRRMSEFSDFIRYEIRRNRRHQHPLVLNRAGELGLDYLGYYEDLGTGFDVVSEKLGLSVPLPRSNHFAHKPYRDYYTDDSRRLVEKHWAEDIRLFGYRF